jgi:hypothetical protein
MNTYKLNINLSPTVFLQKLLKEEFTKWVFTLRINMQNYHISIFNNP